MELAARRAERRGAVIADPASARDAFVVVDLFWIVFGAEPVLGLAVFVTFLDFCFLAVMLEGRIGDFIIGGTESYEVARIAEYRVEL